jgi:coenzyme F420-reducing hydrogenase alpha subunit
MSSQPANPGREIRIEVPVLARVEGEGALELVASGGEIQQLRLRIFEPPRYFEKLLEGRHYSEVLDIVARICGICPVAYQMSAAQAMESAFGVRIEPWARDLRRVMYCGEWIQSHALHIHLLAAPDFLGYPNAIALAGDHADIVRRGLSLQSLGNDLIRLCGARSVHPVGVRVGGFHRAPSQAAVRKTLDALHAALPQAEAMLAWTASLELPDDPQTFTSVALSTETQYAIEAGGIVSDQGLDIILEEYEDHFAEHHEPHSTALFSLLEGKPYLVGPLARINLSLDQLGPVRPALEACGIEWPSSNMFHSVVARAAETLYVIHEAIRLLEGYSVPERPYVEVRPQAGQGCGATEAPRGLLWHRYRFDDRGYVRSARIVPPTSQNQARIEQDLRASLQALGLDEPDEALRLRAETVIRNYDPCISCATHFLTLKVDRQ